MPKLRSGAKTQTNDLARQNAVTKSRKKAEVAKTQTVGHTEAAAATDRMEGAREKPDSSSQLGDVVASGLKQLAEHYYGDTKHGAPDGLKLLFRAAGDPGSLDKTFPPDLRAIKAGEFARSIPGLDKQSAAALVESLALLLTPSNA